MRTITIIVALLLISNVIIGAFAVAGPKVIIVGAGMSGISTAKTLSDAGIKDILILEATDRIGGRMRKASFTGLNVEVGANWVIKEANKVKIFGEKLSKSIPPDSHGDISILASQRLEDLVPSTALEMVMDYFNYDYEFAEPPRVTSLQKTIPLPTFANFGKEAYFVADQRGFESLVYDLAGHFLRMTKNSSIVDPRLLLGKVVRDIRHSMSGVTVTTEDGSFYDTNYVIISVSIGVLQSKLIKFKPDLP
ncbi:Flavin containing amine oxidoreductase, partial [Musa troglodytarum]